MAASLTRQQVLSVHHWSDRLFTIRCTRDAGLKYANGQFVMMGLEVEGKPLTRAYSMASANYEEVLEFYSIKVQEGPLTSRLQHVKVGDELLVGSRAVGTLTIANLRAGANLWLLATGTGLAPFLSIVRDPETYERFERVILVHGVRFVGDLSYSDHLKDELPTHDLLGDLIRDRLTYVPTVTRDSYHQTGRITDLIRDGRLFTYANAQHFSPERDRVMICGSNEMLKETKSMLEERGFMEGDSHNAGDFLYEKAFVEK
jgi:ferredoxin/flavodoxin---NADP+ reductase